MSPTPQPWHATCATGPRDCDKSAAARTRRAGGAEQRQRRGAHAYEPPWPVATRGGARRRGRHDLGHWRADVAAHEPPHRVRAVPPCGAAQDAIELWADVGEELAAVLVARGDEADVRQPAGRPALGVTPGLADASAQEVRAL